MGGRDRAPWQPERRQRLGFLPRPPRGQREAVREAPGESEAPIRAGLWPTAVAPPPIPHPTALGPPRANNCDLAEGHAPGDRHPQ